MRWRAPGSILSRAAAVAYLALALCTTLSAPLRAGGEEGEAVVTIVGALTAEGVECPSFRADNGTLYSLLGDLDGLRPGDRAEISGRLGQVSFCMQGTPFVVEAIRPLR